MVELKQSYHHVTSYGRSTMHYSHVCSDGGIINPAMLIKVLFTMFLLYPFYVWRGLDLQIFTFMLQLPTVSKQSPIQVCSTGVSYSPGM